MAAALTTAARTLPARTVPAGAGSRNGAGDGSGTGAEGAAGRGPRRALLGAAVLRAAATGMGGVLLGIYLAELGLSPLLMGLVTAAGLAGAVAGTLLVTLGSPAWSSRRALIAFGAAGALGTALLALASRPWTLAAVAFLGMVNGVGRDRGPLAVIEQALLPATTTAAGRTRAFAWYTALQDAGHALGSLAAALPALLAGALGLAELASLRGALLVQAALLAASALAYVAGGRAPAAAPASPLRAPLSPESRVVVRRLSLLFAVDGLGGGFLAAALLSWFLHERFGLPAAAIGGLFFAGRVANLLSHFAAAWLARRIGLLATVVWTHLPSSLLLLGLAFAPDVLTAAVFYLLRECLVEMDVPTRQSYVVAVVRPEERTAAAGWTQLARLGSWAVGPSLAGWMMTGLALAAPLVAAAVVKVAYDLALWSSFRHLRPEEETTSGAA